LRQLKWVTRVKFPVVRCAVPEEPRKHRGIRELPDAGTPFDGTINEIFYCFMAY